MLFAGKHPPHWRFAIKLRYGDEIDTNRVEHLWFEVLGLRPGRIQAKLVSAPTYMKSMNVGDVTWHDLNRLSDWRVLTETGSYDPESADQLFESVAKLVPTHCT